jgi:hypothetical protein
VSVESLTSLFTGGISALGVLGIFVALILGGRLITRGAHDEIVNGLQSTIADKNRQVELLTQAVQRERERGDAGVLAAQVTKDLVQGLRRAAGP